jgi:hypothetical protein
MTAPCEDVRHRLSDDDSVAAGDIEHQFLPLKAPRNRYIDLMCANAAISPIIYLTFPSMGCSGEPRPEPGEPIGSPLAVCPTPTPGALTPPGCATVLVPLMAAFCSPATVLAVLD